MGRTQTLKYHFLVKEILTFSVNILILLVFPLCLQGVECRQTYQNQNSLPLSSNTLIHGYDLREKAFLLDTLSNWNSKNEAFNNKGARIDGSGFKCWKGSPFGNVWFKFKATTKEIDFRVRTGGDLGSIKEPQVVLFNEKNRLLDCMGPFGKDYQDVRVRSERLIPGAWYFVSVDGNTDITGTFTLSVHDSIIPDFDDRAGAYELKSINDWCSQPFAFNNAGMSIDGNKPICWDLELVSNVWFKFRAITPEIDIQIKTGTGEGTIKYARAVLYDAKNNVLACSDNLIDTADIRLKSKVLIPGALYYLMVDNRSNNQFTGSFMVCISSEIKVVYDSIFLNFSYLNTSRLQIKTSDDNSVTWNSGVGTGVLGLEAPIPRKNLLDTIKIYPENIPTALKEKGFHLAITYNHFAKTDSLFIWRSNLYNKFNPNFYFSLEDTLMIFDRKPNLYYSNYEEGLVGRVFNRDSGLFKINLPFPENFGEIIFKVFDSKNYLVKEVKYPQNLVWDGEGVDPGLFNYSVELKKNNEKDLVLEGQFVIEE